MQLLELVAVLRRNVHNTVRGSTTYDTQEHRVFRSHRLYLCKAAVLSKVQDVSLCVTNRQVDAVNVATCDNYTSCVSQDRRGNQTNNLRRRGVAVVVGALNVSFVASSTEQVDGCAGAQGYGVDVAHQGGNRSVRIYPLGTVVLEGLKLCRTSDICVLELVD